MNRGDIPALKNIIVIFIVALFPLVFFLDSLSCRAESAILWGTGSNTNLDDLSLSRFTAQALADPRNPLDPPPRKEESKGFCPICHTTPKIVHTQSPEVISADQDPFVEILQRPRPVFPFLLETNFSFVTPLFSYRL